MLTPGLKFAATTADAPCWVSSAPISAWFTPHAVVPTTNDRQPPASPAATFGSTAVPRENSNTTSVPANVPGGWVVAGRPSTTTSSSRSRRADATARPIGPSPRTIPRISQSSARGASGGGPSVAGHEKAADTHRFRGPSGPPCLEAPFVVRREASRPVPPGRTASASPSVRRGTWSPDHTRRSLPCQWVYGTCGTPSGVSRTSITGHGAWSTTNRATCPRLCGSGGVVSPLARPAPDHDERRVGLACALHDLPLRASPAHAGRGRDPERTTCILQDRVGSRSSRPRVHARRARAAEGGRGGA